jgi:aryl-alcohol dehydrogenase-like predicted oxidoreductase
METRLIGSLSVSIVGLGCNNFGTFIDEQDSRTVVEAALDERISFFDTADIYGGGRSGGRGLVAHTPRARRDR